MIVFSFLYLSFDASCDLIQSNSSSLRLLSKHGTKDVGTSSLTVSGHKKHQKTSTETKTQSYRSDALPRSTIQRLCTVLIRERNHIKLRWKRQVEIKAQSYSSDVLHRSSSPRFVIIPIIKRNFVAQMLCIETYLHVR